MPLLGSGRNQEAPVPKAHPSDFYDSFMKGWGWMFAGVGASQEVGFQYCERFGHDVGVARAMRDLGLSYASLTFTLGRTLADEVAKSLSAVSAPKTLVSYVGPDGAVKKGDLIPPHRSYRHH